MWVSQKGIEHDIITQPPKNISEDISDITLFSKICISRFEEVTNLKIKKNDAFGWVNLKNDVDFHSDNGGRCFLYVAKGSGILHLEKKSIPVIEGYFLEFNDKKEHAFEIYTPNVTLFVCNISGNLKDCIKKSKRYLGRHV